MRSYLRTSLRWRLSLVLALLAWIAAPRVARAQPPIAGCVADSLRPRHAQLGAWRPSAVTRVVVYAPRAALDSLQYVEWQVTRWAAKPARDVVVPVCLLKLARDTSLTHWTIYARTVTAKTRRPAWTKLGTIVLPDVP